MTADKIFVGTGHDAILQGRDCKAGVDRIWAKYFATLTNICPISPGCMGDERTYDYAVALRARAYLIS